MDPKNGQLKQIGKIENQAYFQIECSDISSDKIFLGTKNKGLIMVGPDGYEIFDESKGCPSKNILSMTYLNKNLYLGFYGSFAKFDLKTKTFDIISSNKSVKIKNKLDGGNIYWIPSMISDPKYNSLWFTVIADLNRYGIWKYNGTTGKLNLVCGQSTSKYLVFNDNAEILFGSGGINLLNPQTNEIRQLQNYPYDATKSLSFDNECVMIGKDILQPSGKLFSDDGKVYNLGKSWSQIERFGSGAVAVSYYNNRLNLSLIQPKETIKNDTKEK
jgi:hypothetical protein